MGYTKLTLYGCKIETTRGSPELVVDFKRTGLKSMSKVSDRKPLFVDTSKLTVLGCIFYLWNSATVEVVFPKQQISFWFDNQNHQTDSTGRVLNTPLEYRALIDPNVFSKLKEISKNIIENYSPHITTKTTLSKKKKKILMSIPKTLTPQEQRQKDAAERVEKQKLKKKKLPKQHITRREREKLNELNSKPNP